MIYKAIIAYDGSSFLGWQKTKEGPSIQQTLEQTMMKLTQKQVGFEAASRTDRGVHAEGQVVSFCMEEGWPPEKLQRGLNALLPVEIRVLHVEAREDLFHPTLHAKEKEYHYRMCLTPFQNPIHRHYSWHFRYPLDIEPMKQGAQALLGTHDFSSFANEPEENPICTLRQVNFSFLETNRLQMALIGDRFLYKMARTLAGTLAYVGCGKLDVHSIPEILQSKSRSQAGITAPALGLFLHRVSYDFS